MFLLSAFVKDPAFILYVVLNIFSDGEFINPPKSEASKFLLRNLIRLGDIESLNRVSLLEFKLCGCGLIKSF